MKTSRVVGAGIGDKPHGGAEFGDNLVQMRRPAGEREQVPENHHQRGGDGYDDREGAGADAFKKPVHSVTQISPKNLTAKNAKSAKAREVSASMRSLCSFAVTQTHCTRAVAWSLSQIQSTLLGATPGVNPTLAGMFSAPVRHLWTSPCASQKEKPQALL